MPDNPGDGLGPAEVRRGPQLKHLAIAAKVVISGVLLWLLASATDGAHAYDRLRSVQPGYLVAGLALESLAILIATWRWSIVLSVVSLPTRFRTALQIVYIGLFFNQVLPSNIGGDAVRVWRLFRGGSNVAAAVVSVTLDRVVALVGLAILVTLGLPVALSITGDRGAVAGLAGTVVVIALSVVVLLGLERVSGWLRVVHLNLERGIAYLSREARNLFLSPGPAVAVLGLSVLIHAVAAVTVFMLAQGLGIAVGLDAYLVLVPPVILVSVVPVSIAGWGVREGAMIVALGFAGVPSDDAFILSVVFGLVILTSSLPGGLIWLMTDNRKSQ